MKTQKQKRLLVLGGGDAALNVVLEAQKQGMYTIATDNLPTGTAKEQADKSYGISTTDIEKLKELVQDEQIDGVFSGPSEFNIKNVMRLCEETGLNFYATREQWDICSNKYTFKQLCQKFNVPSVKDYQYGKEKIIEFPVIVKPVDGHSSRGISVCNNQIELDEAYKKALSFSDSKQVIVEKYIESAGVGFNVRYIAHKGKLHLVLTGDTYTVDSDKGTALINGVGIYPSRFTKYYIDNIDEKVKKMFEFIGIDHASLFMQAIIEDDIYFHEMGLRLSGGLLYKLVEPITDINDMKMMLRYAVGEDFTSEPEIRKIDPYLSGKQACILNIPLKAGTIKKISGIEKIKENVTLQAFEQYYHDGDIVKPEFIGTIQQHMGRFKFVADSMEEIIEKIDYIQKNIIVENNEGEDMIYKYFDIKRLVNNKIKL